MAVADLTQSTLQLVLHEGTDPDTGNPVFKTKNFNNVKPTATADQLYAVAIVLEGLQQRPLYTINRRDNSEIREA
ncbi:DUF1659 domain-containing protein [Oceanobacillus sp. FSL H7-0719]|uniref:DUF1659 domain-containing protein n=1 Tax=Oceanobacillus sp. FSL H7-0719 TaxID=2954507 RepID=UPI00324B61D5